ncbi:ribbon-helix-helix domain-containing protein [Stakelama sp. CBK3Z-3]|uniref:Ribbon-helix-helix domain-containing protein n=1 Tax=Stakelama flava TaxID=2860338 RepID=A0ABS6XLQ0_9SPHN|nr:CopG family transcriptional regulator [Stakelama flava]MBW4331121.1 ribbon-helix-helix domain-containing protein [Stakelama flava]
MKPRHHLYFDEALSAELEALATSPGTTKSAIVADALRAYLARRGAREVDTLLKPRLDHMSADLSRLRRDLDILLETLALFVRWQLTVQAPLPEADAAARAVGRERFEAFVTQVGRRLGTGRRTFGENQERRP